MTRWVILQKARGQAYRRSGIALPLVVGIRFQVLFHSGHPGSFHLSLTVLVHYRSPRVFSLGGWTPLLPTGLACPVVLKVTGRSLLTFAYGTITRYGWPFQYHSASEQICNSFGSLQRPRRALLPPPRNDCSLDTRQVWAVPLSLATTQGMISLPGGTKMFQFPPCPPSRLCIQRAVPRHSPGWVPPFGNLRIEAC